jgi:nucleolar protein 56
LKLSSKIYLLETSIGLLLYDESGVMVEKELFESDPLKIGALYSKIEKLERPEELTDFFNRAKQKNITEIVTENEKIKVIYSENSPITIVCDGENSLFKKLRRELPQKLKEIGPNINETVLLGTAKTIAVRITKEGIRENSEQGDAHIKHIVETFEDILKFINILSLRLKEWYGIHFPEFTDNLVSDIKKYALIVNKLGLKSNFTAENLKTNFNMEDVYANEIEKQAKFSMGADFNEIQIRLVQDLSNQVLQLIDFREKLEHDLEALLKQIAPNILALTGSQLAGKIITLAGGLKELAIMPSSTIQVLGAEKALFRALRKNTEAPKHGIIYTWSGIRGAKLWQRGKISRLLAGKISICAKIDYFKGQFIGDAVLKDVEKKMEEIRVKFPEAPKKKKVEKQEEKGFSNEKKQMAKRPKRHSSSKYRKMSKPGNKGGQ